MVIKGKSIRHAKAHARHLMRQDQNDRIELIEFDETGAAPSLEALFTEYQALAENLTKASKGIYIAALNPKLNETLNHDQWKEAVDLLESELNLTGQPRSVILHEKQGREHVHVVWQRTDIDRERVVDDQDNYAAHERAAREIEQRFGLEVTKGVHTRDKATEPRPDRANPQSEYERANRGDFDLKAFKAEIKLAFEEAEHGKAFTDRLEEMGCYLVRGDKKNTFMILPPEGEAFVLSSTLKGISAKEWKAKLSPLTPQKLKTLSEVKSEIANPAHVIDEAEAIKAKYEKSLDETAQRHSQESDRLKAQHEMDNQAIKHQRQQEKPTGVYKLLQDVMGLSWWSTRLHDAEDRERLAIQKQDLVSLKRDHKNEIQELTLSEKLALHELDEANKPEHPPLKNRFEVSREEAQLNEFQMAVKAHDQYFNEKLSEIGDESFRLKRRINKTENREAYLESMNLITVDAFEKYYADGKAAYQNFREACGLVTDGRMFVEGWKDTHSNKWKKARNLKKAMKTLIQNPEIFGPLIKDNWSALEVGKRREDMKHDIEDTARRIHYMTVRVENERKQIPIIEKQLERCEDRRMQALLDFSNERLGHLRNIERSGIDLNAQQLKQLSKAEKQTLKFAQENMKDSLKRGFADEYLKQHDQEIKRQNRQREHDPDEPHL